MLKFFKSNAKDLLIVNNSSINTDIMNFLSIDCSMDIGSLFLKIENKTFSKFLQSDKFNNDLLMKQILDFLKENTIKFDDISQIYVNQGPGNFSGLRGSIAVAKGICLAKNLKLYGYNTFVLSCASFFDKKNSIFSFIKFRKKYFIKKFNKNLKSISAIKEIEEDKIIKNYDNKFKVIPNSMSKYLNEKILKLNNLCLVDLDHNKLEFLKSKGLLDKDIIKPLYLS